LDIPSDINDPKNEMKEFPRLLNGNIKLHICHNCSSKILETFKKLSLDKNMFFGFCEIKFFKWIVNYKGRIESAFEFTENLYTHCYYCNFYCGKDDLHALTYQSVYGMSCTGPICDNILFNLPPELKKKTGYCNFCVNIARHSEERRFGYQWCNSCINVYLNQNEELPDFKNSKGNIIKTFDNENGELKLVEKKMALFNESITLKICESEKIFHKISVGYTTKVKKEIEEGYNNILSKVRKRFSTFIVCCDICGIMPKMFSERRFLKIIIFNYVFPYKKEISSPIVNYGGDVLLKKSKNENE
jgi:hypothetical protein